jgi:hypothetical protein
LWRATARPNALTTFGSSVVPDKRRIFVFERAPNEIGPAFRQIQIHDRHHEFFLRHPTILPQ